VSLTARRRRGGFDVWPGFVDALTSLVMVLIFVLLVFAIGQFVLSDTLAVKTRALDVASARSVELAKALSLSEDAVQRKAAQLAELGLLLDQGNQERDRLKQALESGASREAAMNADIAALTELKRQLESEVTRLVGESDRNKAEVARQTELNAASLAQIELLNRQSAVIRDQLSQLAAALDLANRDGKTKDIRIADLGAQLNVALANQVSKLERYRSEFFGRLRETLGGRNDVRVVGDRFVVPTDILFESGSADLDSTAEARLAQLVATLREVSVKIPPSIDWVLRIDGHTDRAPIHTDRYPSNWELSTARAVAIVKFLSAQGIPADRLSANGFGEFQPLDAANTDAAYQRNRRIELQLTNR
jgi:chemotaxis protein MotB